MNAQLAVRYIHTLFYTTFYTSLYTTRYTTRCTGNRIECCIDCVFRFVSKQKRCTNGHAHTPIYSFDMLLPQQPQIHLCGGHGIPNYPRTWSSRSNDNTHVRCGLRTLRISRVPSRRRQRRYRDGVSGYGPVLAPASQMDHLKNQPCGPRRQGISEPRGSSSK